MFFPCMFFVVVLFCIAFFNISFYIVGVMNEDYSPGGPLWSLLGYIPRFVSDLNYREVKGQVKGQGSVAYTL